MVYYWFNDIVTLFYGDILTHQMLGSVCYQTFHGDGIFRAKSGGIINKMVVCHGNTMGKPTMIYGDVIFGLHVISDIGGSLAISRENVML